MTIPVPLIHHLCLTSTSRQGDIHCVRDAVIRGDRSIINNLEKATKISNDNMKKMVEWSTEAGMGSSRKHWSLVGHRSCNEGSTTMKNWSSIHTPCSFFNLILFFCLLRRWEFLDRQIIGGQMGTRLCWPQDDWVIDRQGITWSMLEIGASFLLFATDIWAGIIRRTGFSKIQESTILQITIFIGVKKGKHPQMGGLSHVYICLLLFQPHIINHKIIGVPLWIIQFLF